MKQTVTLFSYSKALCMFLYHKSTLSDYTNSTVNVCMCSVSSLLASGPSLVGKYLFFILKVFTKVGAQGNKPVVGVELRPRRIQFIGNSSGGREVVIPEQYCSRFLFLWM